MTEEFRKPLVREKCHGELERIIYLSNLGPWDTSDKAHIVNNSTETSDFTQDCPGNQCPCHSPEEPRKQDTLGVKPPRVGS